MHETVYKPVKSPPLSLSLLKYFQQKGRAGGGEDLCGGGAVHVGQREVVQSWIEEKKKRHETKKRV